MKAAAQVLPPSASIKGFIVVSKEFTAKSWPSRSRRR
jgi:hypothetical protein